MQTAIRLPYQHVGTACHPRDQTDGRHQPGNGREGKKKAPAARKRNGFSDGEDPSRHFRNNPAAVQRGKHQPQYG